MDPGAALPLPCLPPRRAMRPFADEPRTHSAASRATLTSAPWIQKGHVVSMSAASRVEGEQNNTDYVFLYIRT
jgi:hypothetical protein